MTIKIMTPCDPEKILIALARQMEGGEHGEKESAADSANTGRRGQSA